MINEFRGQYSFLSNFHICKEPFVYDDIVYSHSEGAFQSQKTLDIPTRRIIARLSPRDSKTISKQLALRPHWDLDRVAVMRHVLLAKFAPGTFEYDELLKTGSQTLVEGNTWNDKFWGVDLKTGSGQNHLGRLLMEIRKELRA
jgi:ribA/ribD-fused uncharacterized protein